MAKIKSLKPLNNGLDRDKAEEFWIAVEGFAAYSFNKSHSVAYSLISYQTMWLKVKFPAEFFAGLLTYVKDDRRAAALTDMKRLGIKLQPPDINLSSDVFEPLHTHALIAPLNAVKGVSGTATNAIIAERQSAGPFASIKDLETRVPGRKCNVRVRESLDKVGAFARIEPGQEPSDHASRRRDQMELMPGLITDAVIIDRPMDTSFTALTKLGEQVTGWKECTRCELTGLCHPKPYVTVTSRVMLITDGPNYKEEGADHIGAGGHMEALETALELAGLSIDDVYITTLIKSPKPERKKAWSNTTLSECPAHLDAEIALLRPPLIVTLGSLATGHLVKDIKGGFAEQAGRVVYDKARDINILIGMNPNAVFYDASKQELLNQVIAKIPDMLPLT